MARTGGDPPRPVRRASRPVLPGRDPLSRALHHLSNNIHSLALRLTVLQRSKLPAGAKVHVDAADRLAHQSADLIERIHEMVDIKPPAAKIVRPGPPRR